MYNIILVTIDCLRADHLSCLGYSRITTPNIDKLAESGALFYNVFSNGPYTAMSFPSILSSTYPLMYPYIKENNLFMSNERTSFVEVLKENGYKTAAFHSNPHLSAYFGYGKGFDTFEDHIPLRPNNFVSEIKSKTKAKYFKYKNFYNILRKGHFFISNVKNQLYLYFQKSCPYTRANVLNQEVLDWISKNLENFFIWIHYMDIHEPYLPPQPQISHIRGLRLQKRTIYKNKSKGDLKKISYEDVKTLVNLYDMGLSYIDHELGTFLKSLKDFAISLENTFVILTSDHGEEFMEHGDLGHLHKLYDELLHVPLIIAGPGLSLKKVKNQVSHLDLAPTVLDLVDIKDGASFLGRSLVPLITSSLTKNEEDVISEYWYRDERGYSYRTKNWKCIITFDAFGVKKELYNLNSDPGEQTNIAEKNKSKVKKFFTLLKKHIAMERSFQSLTEKKRIQKRIKELKMKILSEYPTQLQYNASDAMETMDFNELSNK